MAIPADDEFWDLVVSDPGPLNLFAGPIYSRSAAMLFALRQEIGDEAFLELTRTVVTERSGGTITILHTEVPKELGGRGIGTALAHGMLELIRAEGLKVKPLCPFVNAQRKKHPEWADAFSV